MSLTNSLLPDISKLQRVRSELALRLQKSFDYLLFDVGSVGSNYDALKCVLESEFADGRLPSSLVFASHEALLQAGLAGDQNRFDKACEDFLALPFEHFFDPERRVSPYCENSLGLSSIALLRAAYLDDVGLTADLVAPDEKDIRKANLLVNEALDLKHKYAPAWAQEFDLLVSDIFLAVNRDPKKNGFGGASVFSAFGSIMVNPRSQTNLVTMFMTLVHESSHSRLFLHHLDDPVLLNDGDETYLSPLRTEPRPMEGIFHAAWVSGRMVAAARQVMQGGYSGEAADELRKYMDRAKRTFEDCTIPIDRDSKFTEFGRELYEDAKRLVNEK